MKYDHIIRMGRPASSHPHMSMLERAAQFSPFAALTGYDDEVEEAARLTDARIEIGEETQAELDSNFAAVMEHLHEQPEVEVVYFAPDEKKEGGRYLTARGRLRTFDAAKRELVFTDRRCISLDEVTALHMVSGGEKEEV